MSRLNVRGVFVWMVKFTKVTLASTEIVYGIGPPAEHSPMGALRMVARKQQGTWCVVTGADMREMDATPREAAQLEAMPNDGAMEELHRTRQDAFERHARGSVN